MDQGNRQLIHGNRFVRCMAAVREFLIICGGYLTGSTSDCNDLLSYNTINGRWKLHELPLQIKDAFKYCKICVGGNKVYICGTKYKTGDTPFVGPDFLVSLDVTKPDCEILYLRTEDEDENSSPRVLIILFFYHNESLYIMGYGEGGDSLDMIYKFCIRTSTWSFVQTTCETPININHPYCHVYKDQYYFLKYSVYIFDATSFAQKKFRELKVFDISQNVWTTKETRSRNQQYPCGRCNESYAFSSNCVYMSGGGGVRAYTCYSDIWRLDLESMEWFKLDYTLQTGIECHSMTIVDDEYLYSVGGKDVNLCHLHTMERFTLKPPSLYRLCLETVCRSPNMTSYVKSLPASITDELNLNENDYNVDT
ncbi:Kelch domain-containing protein 10 [Thelohanellus kitauei]|uniref:Kelch domain-containing protein 10 n=1 Tax=Thelohanellus kitauei TaxID=669202 RepID=A0A0C2NLE9_THEKT|nr:Kelch domain-containing protein 10 [Thelohanellus kitauei]